MGNKSRPVLRPVIVSLSLSVILAACSLDYGPELAESLDQTPELVLRNVTWTTVRDGTKVSTFTSTLAEDYSDLREFRLSESAFKEFDEEGKTRVEGTAGRAKVNKDTNDASLSNEITLHSLQEETALKAKTLQWMDQRKFLSSAPDEVVRVERKKNSVMEGTGFTLDMKTRTLSFSRSVTGTYVDDGESESAEELSTGLPSDTTAIIPDGPILPEVTP